MEENRKMTRERERELDNSYNPSGDVAGVMMSLK